MHAGYEHAERESVGTTRSLCRVDTAHR